MEIKNNETNIHMGFEICELGRHIKKAVDKQMENFHISPMESWLIRYLYCTAEEKTYQKDLEKIFHLSRSTATGLLQGLEKKGYLIRENDLDDIRKKRIFLTEKGILLQQGIIGQLEYFDKNLRSGITLEEQHMLLCLLKKIQNNLGDVPMNLASAE